MSASSQKNSPGLWVEASVICVILLSIFAFGALVMEFNHYRKQEVETDTFTVSMIEKLPPVSWAHAACVTSITLESTENLNTQMCVQTNQPGIRVGDEVLLSFKRGRSGDVIRVVSIKRYQQQGEI